MQYSIFQDNFPTSFTKYWGFLPEIITGITACQMVIFLISLTYIPTWNLKKHYFFSTYFLWEQKICDLPLSHSLMISKHYLCSVHLDFPAPEWHWTLLHSSTKALAQGLGHTGCTRCHLASHYVQFLSKWVVCIFCFFPHQIFSLDFLSLFEPWDNQNFTKRLRTRTLGAELLLQSAT